MCTVLLRFAPGTRWPLLLAAVRDEFADRPWDPPGRHQKLDPGEHIVVNAGVDATGDPLVPHLMPLLRGVADPDPRPGLAPEQAWGGWLPLLGGDGLDPADPRALVVRRRLGARTFASTSATLVALGPDAVRYDFTANPGLDASWHEIEAT